MGVPGFCRNIVDNYEKIHFCTENMKPDYFYVDFNPIIYNAKFELDKTLDSQLGSPSYEEQLIKLVIKKAVEMVNLVKPQKLVYVAIDGPAPMAKMIKQRERRFKKIYEKKLLSIFRTKAGCVGGKCEGWDTSNITPGTNFMYNLNKAFKSAIRSNRFGKVQVIFSGSDIPGEGEHKFLRHIESQPERNPVVVIFSNDADLLMLANRFGGKEIYILMNTQHSIRAFKDIYKEDEYVYIDVNSFQDAFMNELGVQKVSTRAAISDFVFYNMFAGNDFVQPLFFAKMRKRHTYGMLFSIYKKLLPCHRDSLVIFENKKPLINHRFLCDFVRELANQETWRWGKQQEFVTTYNEKDRTKDGDDEPQSTDPMDIATKEYEDFQHTYYFDKKHLLFAESVEHFEKFNTKRELERKFVYYEHFFDIDPKHPMWLEKVWEVCHEYMKSMLFCLHYYFDELPSWSYFYPYRAAPMATDLSNYMRKKFAYDYCDINELLVELKMGEPFRPFQQLMLVLPPDNDILPTELNELMITPSLKKLYPEEFELDIVNGEKHIYAEPILPHMCDKEVAKVLGQMSKVQLPTKYKALNKITNKPFVHNESLVLGELSSKSKAREKPLTQRVAKRSKKPKDSKKPFKFFKKAEKK